jgi:AcrR family transcriptional regulator
LSYHFGGKQSLLVAAFQALADDYRRELLIGPNPEIRTDIMPEQLLPTIIRRAVGGPGKFDDRAWLGFWGCIRSDADLQQLNRELFDEVAAYLGDIIGRIAKNKGVSVDTDRAGRSLAVIIEGAWLHLTVGTLGFTFDEAVDLCEKHAWSLVADSAV